jgi:hypothetical protein
MTPVVFTVDEAADKLGVPPDWVRMWMRDSKTTSAHLSDVDLKKMSEFATNQRKKIDSLRAKTRKSKTTFSPKDSNFDDGKQENFTVAQIASLWQLSRDTIQRLFQDEPGVVTLGDKNPRGKRRRVTLRIPRVVMDRVKKRRSNPS